MAITRSVCVFFHLDFTQAPPATLTILEGDGDIIVCEHSLAGISWLKDGFLINQDSLKDACSCEANRTNLTFSAVTVESAGLYICQAILRDSSVQMCTVNVTVESSQSANVANHAVTIALAFFFYTAQPPQVTIDESGVQVSPGNPPTLTLRPNIDFGSPKATITWSVDGTILENIDSEGVLTVTKVQYGGNYTITASNTVGNSSDTITVTIGTAFGHSSLILLISLAFAADEPVDTATTTMAQPQPSTSATTRMEDSTTVNNSSSASLLTIHSTSLLLAGVICIAANVYF